MEPNNDATTVNLAQWIEPCFVILKSSESENYMGIGADAGPKSFATKS